MQQVRSMFAIAAALLVLGGCERGPARATAPEAPSLGVTASVTVSCPRQMAVGATGQCSAIGSDPNGFGTSSTVSAWSSSAPSVASVSSSGAVTAHASGNARIYATVDGVTGSNWINVGTASAPPISVSLLGPGTIKPNVTCWWWAEISGGLPPYNYSWTQSAGSGSASGYDHYGSSPTSFNLTVTVGDASGQSASATRRVSVSTLAKPCPV